MAQSASSAGQGAERAADLRACGGSGRGGTGPAGGGAEVGEDRAHGEGILDGSGTASNGGAT
jgi:hypothetical protein